MTEGMESVLKIFPDRIRDLLGQVENAWGDMQEIRFRAGRPVVCCWDGNDYFLTVQGTLSREAEECFIADRTELKEMLSCMAGYSLYAFDEELKQGYLTLPGGHRVGIAGKIVMDGERIQCVRNISFLNVRLSHEKKGCADRVLPYLFHRGEICHTLILSPPGCGKTTLLRDIVRQISDGYGSHAGYNVAVADERSEIGGCYQGIPQNDLGRKTDVLDGCPKALGMMMLVRSMSPDVIAVDEIGSEQDARAIETVLHCGCRLLATVHGNSMEDLMNKPLLSHMIRYRYFQRFVVLEQNGGPGHVRYIFDDRGTELYG